MTEIESGPETGDAVQVVTVEIMGQRFQIRSTLDVGHIHQLASYVDDQIQTASEHSTGGDAVRIAVLAAMNIADDYFRCRKTEAALKQALTRAGEIEQMVQAALADAAPEPAAETQETAP